MQIGAVNGMFGKTNGVLATGQNTKLTTTSMQDKMSGTSFSQTVGEKAANNISTEPVKDAFNSLNASQIQAERSAELFATGQTESLHKVIVDMEEAMMSMRLATQVRNKAVEAYQEIMRMQI